MLRKTACTTLLLTLVLLPVAGTARRARPVFEPAVLDAETYAPRVGAFLILVDGTASMHATTREVRKIEVARAVAQSLARSIPQLDYRGGVRSFGQGSCLPAAETSLLQGMQRYSRGGAQAAIDRIRCTGGHSALAAAFAAAAQDLSGAQGETAVILVSDGQQMGDAEVAAARHLHQTANACIYAIQVGVSRRGADLLQRLVDAGGCGRRADAWDLVDSRQMARLVTDALLDADSDGDGVPDRRDRCPDTARGAGVDANGCPLRDQEISATVRGAQVLFAFDSAEIRGEYQRGLDRVAAHLKRNPDLHLAIEGHADDSGDDAYNQRLSEKRAQATRDYLLGRGVAASQLTVTGLGETQPLYPNDTALNRAKNRRTDFRPLGEASWTAKR